MMVSPVMAACDYNSGCTLNTTALNHISEDIFNGTYTQLWLFNVSKGYPIQSFNFILSLMLPIIEVFSWAVIPVFVVIFMGVAYMATGEPMQVLFLGVVFNAALGVFFPGSIMTIIGTALMILIAYILFSVVRGQRDST